MPTIQFAFILLLCYMRAVRNGAYKNLVFNTHENGFASHSGHVVLSSTGIVSSNPTRVIDVHVCLLGVCVILCVGSGLATGSSAVRGALPTLYTINNSVALVCERTIPRKRSPLVGEVSANFLG
jgi:hypothetical protein